MATFSNIHEVGRVCSLTFYCEDLPADAAALAAGRNPNGYFWEGVASFAFAHLLRGLELDSEAGMFSAIGTKEDLLRLQAAIEPLLASPARLTEVLTRAAERGFEFDD